MEQESELRKKLNEELKQAMKSGDTIKRSTLRLLMAAITNAEIAKRHATLTDGDILGIITKEVKQRQDSIDAFKQGNRQDLVDKETAEMKILQGYLPEQMTHEEIVAAAQKVIAEVGAQGPGDKGKVMGKLIAQCKGKADGGEINAVVTELLAS